MREDAPPGEVLAGAVEYWCQVSAWLGGELLAEDVPVARGRVVWTVSQDVPGTLTITVPRFDAGVDWLPSRPDSPLARFGQVLDVSVWTRSIVTNTTWETRQGQFKIYDWKESGDAIEVAARSMLLVAEEDRFTSPMSSRKNGTLASEFRRLLPDSLGLVIDPGLVDRRVPTMSWDENRLGALYEIADAWPARLRETPWGEVTLLPPSPDTPAPVVTLRDGEGGTVVSAPRSDTRAQVYNRVVARGQELTDAGRPRFQATEDIRTGPMATSGPYGVVTRFWSSPLVTSQVVARRSAATMVQNSAVRSTTIPVSMPADPRFELDDPVEVIWRGRRAWGWVTGIDLPLTIRDGAMRLDVGVAP